MSRGPGEPKTKEPAEPALLPAPRPLLEGRTRPQVSAGRAGRPGSLTSSRNLSASDARPAATHWKEAFWPALTSSSPSLEKCGALSKETEGGREESGAIKRFYYLFSCSQRQSQRVFIKGPVGFFLVLRDRRCWLLILQKQVFSICFFFLHSCLNVEKLLLFLF